MLAGLDAVRDHPGDQAARADRVVVARDRVVGLVGIAVRVDEGDHRHAEPTCLAHRELLLAEVDDERCVGLAPQIGDAAEVRLELLELGEHAEALLRRQQLELALLLLAPEVVEPVDAVRDRAPVRQQPAEPAMADVRHADALRLFLDRVLRLFLRADEQDRAVPLGEVAGEVVRLLEQRHRLLEVDDVDAAALGEDESLHLRVPAAGLVAEVHPGLQKLAHGDNSHEESSLWLTIGTPAALERNRPERPAPPPLETAGESGQKRAQSSGFCPRVSLASWSSASPS